MGWAFQREGSWVVKWKNGAGEWRDRRTQSPTKAQARELLRELERKAEFQRVGLAPIDRPSSMTFGALLDWYWQADGAQLRSRHMQPFAEKHLRAALGTLPLPEVTAGRLDGLLMEKAAEL